MGEKAGIYTPTLPLTFGFSLSSAIKNVHTYSHTKWVEGPEKADNCTLPKPSSFGSSLSPAIKKCASIRTSKLAIHVCIHGGWKKRTKKKGKRKRRKRKEDWEEEEKKEKGKELRRYPLFALLFVFLCFAFLCSFLSFFWIQKKGKWRGKRGELPLLLLSKTSENDGEKEI